MTGRNGRMTDAPGKRIGFPLLLVLAALCVVASLEGLMIWTVDRAQHGHASRQAASWTGRISYVMPDLPRRLRDGLLTEADADALRDAGLTEEAFAFKLFDPEGRQAAALRSWRGFAVASIHPRPGLAARPPAADGTHVIDGPPDPVPASGMRGRLRAAQPAPRVPSASSASLDDDVGALPIDHPAIWRMLGTGRIFIELASADAKDDERPRRYAEIFMPLRTADGALAGYVEVYLDMTGFSQEMTRTLRVAGVGLALVAALGFGAPTFGWLAMRGKSRRAEDEMLLISQRDLLTGLPNRSGFAADSSRLAQAAARSGEGLAVVCIDVDGFRSVNDLHGVEMGDAVLRRIATGLRAGMRRGDVLGRLGSDMFGVVVQLTEGTELEPILMRLAARASAPIAAGGRAISVSVSVGACRMPPGELGVDGGLRRAEIALQEARTNGQGQTRVFLPEMEARMRRRRQVERCIRDGIQRNRFSLHYQPLVHAHDGRTRGFEALMRLTDSMGKPISPGEFIPAAEDIGAIAQLGAWALHEATAAAAQWPEPLSVAVNLSVEQFRDGDLVATVLGALEASGLAPERLELEITESLLISNVDQVETQLDALKSIGVSLAMDDFGTGYSSLSYLWRFRFDRLKLDRSFVLAFDQKPDRARTTISAVVALGRRLDMKVTAEGVETEAQARALIELGCDNLQGYYYGAPMPEAQLRDVMRWEADAAHDLAEPRNRPDAFGPIRRAMATSAADAGHERRIGGAR